MRRSKPLRSCLFVGLVRSSGGSRSFSSVSAPSLLSSIEHISTEYDALLLDQFGVLHDGKEALPGARECYERLAAQRKKMAVLSNTSRRRAFAISKLPQLGFDPRALTAFICSGEQAWNHMVEQRSGQSALWISWAEDFQAWDPAYLDGTNVKLAPASEADFLLCHGSMALRDGKGVVLTHMLRSGILPPALEEQLRVGVERNLPMVCANPDLHVVLPDGSRGHMPGLIAQRYLELGGQLIEFGKPHTAAFEAALAELGPDIKRERVLHIGDSLEHDIAGANAAGIHSLFVCGGVHAEELRQIREQLGEDTDAEGRRDGDAMPVSQAQLNELFRRYGVQPTHSTPMLRW